MSLARSDARNIVAELLRSGAELWAEAGRIRFEAPPDVLTHDLRSRLVARKEEVLTLLGQGCRWCPASSAQVGVWIQHQLDPQSPAHWRELPALDFGSVVGPAALDRAIQSLAERHETLRTSFVEIDGVLAQIVHASPRSRPLDDDAAVDHKRATDLAQPGLFHARIVKLAVHHWRLSLRLHQIISDGWSARLLIRDLDALLAAAGGAGPVSSRPTLQYRHVVRAERTWLAGPEAALARAFWQRELAGLAPEIPWPPANDGGSTSAVWEVGEDRANAVEQTARSAGTTSFALLLGLFAASLMRTVGVSDIVIGIPVANRNTPEEEDVVGRLVTMLPIRLRARHPETIEHLVRQVHERLLEGQERRPLPFEAIVEAVAPARSQRRNPIFQVTFAIERSSDPIRSPLQRKAVTVAAAPAADLGPGFDLTVQIRRGSNGLQAVMVGNPARVTDPPLLGCLASRYRQLVEKPTEALEERLDIHTDESTAVVQAIERLPAVAAVAVEGAVDHIVAYVVPATPEPEVQLLEELERAVGDNVCLRVVFASHLTRTADGRMDYEPLRALPQVDKAALGRWVEAVRAQPGWARARVRLGFGTPSQRKLAVHDLVPSASDTPGDRAKDVRVRSAPILPAIATGGELPAPAVDEPRTLLDSLRRAASGKATPDLVFIDDEGRETRLGYADLLALAEDGAAKLLERGIAASQPVVILLDRQLETIVAFWSCVAAGAVPLILDVPSVSQSNEAAAGRIRRAFELLPDPAAFTSERTAPLVTELLRDGGKTSRVVVQIEDVVGYATGRAPRTPSRSDDIAMLAASSGSTSGLKLVKLSHAALLARARAADILCGHTARDVCLGWLPFSHIGAISDWHIRCVRLGCAAVYVETSVITRLPRTWLEFMHRFRATHSWAPNFAFALIGDELRDGDRTDWDLSHVKALVTGGEAVVPSVIKSFLEQAYRYGLDPAALRPAYGMAELGSGITYAKGSPDEPVRYHSLDPAGWRLAAPAAGGILVTDLGPIVPGHTMRIVDGDSVLSEGEVGRLQIRGPAMASGYVPASQDANVFGLDGWLQTGDLGLICDGRLALVGRETDTIIVRGVKISAHDLEACIEATGEVEPSFTTAVQTTPRGDRAGEIAVFAVPRGRLGPSELAGLMRRLRRRAARELGITIDILVPVQPRQVQKTTIGKIQRALMRKRLEAGEFAEQFRQVEADCAAGIPDCLAVRRWRRVHLRPARISSAALTLVLADQHGLATALRERLESAERRCLLVLSDGRCVGASSANMRVDLGDRSDVTRLLDAVLKEGSVDIVDARAYAGNDSAFAHQPLLPGPEFHSTMALLRAAADRPAGGRLRLFAVTSSALPVQAEDQVAPGRAVMVGLLRSAPICVPGLRCRLVDLCPDTPVRDANRLMRELAATDSEHEVAWRGDTRWAVGFASAPLEPPTALDDVLVRGGLYVVSGGLGAIGREVVSFLRRALRARVLVLGRRSISDALARRGLNEPSQTSTDWIYRHVDVADEDAVEHAAAEAETFFGQQLDGAFHLAGVPGTDRIDAISPEMAAAVLRPKIEGSIVLDGILRRRGGGVMVTFSSVNGVLGGSDMLYAAASAFQQAFVHWQRRMGAVDARCLSWSQWRGIGMASSLLEPKPNSDRLALSRPEAMVALEAMLRRPLPDVLIGVNLDSGRLRPLRVDKPAFGLALRLSPGSEESSAFPGEFLCDAAGTAVPVMVDPTIADRPLVTEVERRLASIWTELLGVDVTDQGADFFELGGHSVLAAQMTARIQNAFGVNVPLAMIFECSTLERLAALLDNATPAQGERSLSILPRDGSFPLAPRQRALWLQAMMHPESPALLVPFCVPLLNAIAPERVEHALQVLVDRHEPLRTTFATAQNGEPVQIVHKHAPLDCRSAARPPHAAVEADEWLKNLATSEAERTLDLQSAPLFRAVFARPDHQRQALLLTFHHLIIDGLSIRTLLDELEALLAGAPAESLAPVPVQYVDLASAQATALAGEHAAVLERYWRTKLAGAPERTELPTDRSRPPVRVGRGEALDVMLDDALVSRLECLSRGAGGTLFMGLLTVFLLVLRDILEQDDLVVGTDVDGRESPEAAGVVGYFINQIPLRVDLRGVSSFVEAFRRVRRCLIEAIEHSALPFDRIVAAVSPRRDLSRTPLFQIKIALVDVRPAELARRRQIIGEPEILAHSAITDLMLALARQQTGVCGVLRFDADLYESATIARVWARFCARLRSVTSTREALPYDPTEVHEWEELSQ